MQANGSPWGTSLISRIEGFQQTNSQCFQKITPKPVSLLKKQRKITGIKAKWREDTGHQRELLIIAAPGLLCAWEQYCSKNESLDCITPLEPSLGTDSNDSDRCDNDSGKELRTIKLCSRKQEFIQCKCGTVPLAHQSNYPTRPENRISSLVWARDWS